MAARTTVLVIEDERELSYVVGLNLKREGFQVIAAATAEKGLKLALEKRPALVILDLMLPKMDGGECLRRLRAKSDVPVLIVTGKKKSETDRILGLKLGADDYVVKPFSVEELVERVKAILRRCGPRPPAEAGTLRLGELTLDFDRHDVRVGGKPRRLSPREYDLLKSLVEARGKVLSREALRGKVWGEGDGGAIGERTVDQHVARLRRKLGPEKDRIVTVTGAGYRIVLSA